MPSIQFAVFNHSFSPMAALFKPCEGRQEGVYNVTQNGNAIFAFVIDGQMEVQYRLLQ